MTTHIDEHYEKIISIFSDVLHFVRDLYDRKALFSSISEELEEIKWQGFPLLIKDIIEELVDKIGDAITYSIAIKFLGPKYPDIAMNLGRELILRINELAEWEYDKAVALIDAAEAFHNINQTDLAIEALNNAMNIIDIIPDRSDRSIALAKAVKILTKLGYLDRAIGLLDSIQYEAKKVDAVFNIIDALQPEMLTNEVMKRLEEKLDSYDIPIYRTKIAAKLAPYNPNNSTKYCTAFLRKIDFERPFSYRDISTIYWCVKALLSTNDERNFEMAQKYYLKLQTQMLRRIEERPILELLINLMQNMIEKRLLTNEITETINKLEQHARSNKTQNSLFILNRIAWLRWNMGDPNNAIATFQNTFLEAIKLPAPLSTYSAIDIEVMLSRIMNEFPDTISEQTILQISNIIMPSESHLVEITLSRDSLKFLKEAFKGKPIGRILDMFIMREKLYQDFSLSDKVKGLIIDFIRKGEPIILHYILKFVHRIPIGEQERTIYLRLLGRAIELLSSGRIKEAEQYTELILDKLERDSFPTFLIIIEFLNEYYTKIM